MSKWKQPYGSENRARARPKEPDARQRRLGDEECCALLRADPATAPAPSQRRRHPNENAGDKRP